VRGLIWVYISLTYPVSWFLEEKGEVTSPASSER
jgi:hypothetical protein